MSNSATDGLHTLGPAGRTFPWDVAPHNSIISPTPLQKASFQTRNSIAVLPETG